VFPGSSLHEELQFLTEAGFTNAEALRAATTDAARFLGREKEFGSIATGSQADLVLLERNPLEKISNTTSISGVIRGGAFLDRLALDTLLAQAKSAAKAAGAN